MKTFLLAAAFVLTSSLSAFSINMPTTISKKQCKDGYVWDAEKKKCVKEERGSTRGSY